MTAAHQAHDSVPGERFQFRGGLIALDLVNTVDAWRGPDQPERHGEDRFAGYADLVAWARLAGSLSADEAEALLAAAARRPDEATAVLNRARALRSALHDLLIATRDGVPPEPADIAVVNAEVSAQLGASTLVAGPDGFALTCVDDPSDALGRPLWPVVRSMVDLLTDPADLARVRTCAAETCGWLFLDTSGGRRRWCSMSDCGNAAKVRRFRSRRRAGATSPPA